LLGLQNNLNNPCKLFIEKKEINMTSSSNYVNHLHGKPVGRYAVKALLFSAAVGGAMILVGYGALLLNYALELTDKTRVILGYRVVPGQIDLLGVSVIVVFISIPLLLMLVCYLKYRTAWGKKVAFVWGDKTLANKHAKLISLSEPDNTNKQAQYLADLANTAIWKAELHDAKISNVDNKKLVAEAILKSIEKDVAERAITTGLIIGISSSKLIDHITIVLTALEIQLHVLSKLGRKPSLRDWYELLVRAGSSLFVNDYLNRSQALELSMTTKTIAAGMSYAAGFLESDAVNETSEDLFEHAEKFLSRFATGDVSGAIVNAALVTSEFAIDGALSIGSEGLQLMSQLVESHGDDLMQGVLSGGMLYYHGMAIAADSLALDQQHRNSSQMSRSPFQCMNAVAQTAGNILLGYIRKRKDCIRKRKRDAIKKFPGVQQTIDAVTKTVDKVTKITSWLPFTGTKNNEKLTDNHKTESGNDNTETAKTETNNLYSKTRKLFNWRGKK